MAAQTNHKSASQAIVNHECPICLGSIESPITLHCQHTFCENCIKKVVPQKCPMCRRGFYLYDREKMIYYPEHKYISNIIMYHYI